MANALSFSELSAWEQDEADWERKYILGLKEPPNYPMKRGTYIHGIIGGADRSQEESLYTPDEIRVHDKILDGWKSLVTQPAQFEQKAEVEVEGVPSRGYWDAWIPETSTIVEIKTGGNLWDREKVKNHGQLVFYALQMINLQGYQPKTDLFTASTKTGKVELIPRIISQEELDDMQNRMKKFKFWCIEQHLWEKRLSSKETIEC